MQCFRLPAKDVPTLIEHLGAYGEVIAPHHKGDVSYSFEKVMDAEAVVLDYSRTLLPLKKFFLPPVEKLLDFKLDRPAFTPAQVRIVPQVFFAVHSYDMQAVLRLDHSMLSEHPEANYFKRRKASRFVGISFEPDPYHFSASVGIPVENMEGFDLFLNQVEGDYQLMVVTEKGADLLEGFQKLEPCSGEDNRERHFNQRLRYHYNRLPRVFDECYDSKVWVDVANRCVGCGTCNLTCPTCYCFTVEDAVEVSGIAGCRNRSWDSCMLDSFAEVAGGENFRQRRSQRTRHRIYRKFKYITDNEGLPWCVGCGRCSAFCTAGISLPQILNDLIEEFEAEQITHSAQRASV